MTLRFSRLDRPAIRRLAPGQKVTEHGITAERTADGDVRYSVNVMVDGRRIHRVIGTESGGTTRTQAEIFIEQARTDARAARFNLPAGRKLSLTFADATEIESDAGYIKRLTKEDGKNIAIKKRHLRMYLRPFFGSLRLDAINKFNVGSYRKRRKEQGAAPATINRELATLSHVFTKSVEWKWITSVPFRPVREDEGEGRIIALTDEQCDALMRAAIGSADSYCWLFVAFGLNTAMRHSEILAARFDRLDLDHLRLWVPDAKAGQREQPITPELAAMLRLERDARPDCGRQKDKGCGLDRPYNSHACLTHGGWIFPSLHQDAKIGHRVRMDRPFREAAKAAGLNSDLVTPHVMRHTAITALVEAGAALPTVQRISGHKTLRMVLRYVHIHGEHVNRAIRAIGRTLPELTANETENTTTQELHRSPRRAVK